jgi:hypothetical protein
VSPPNVELGVEKVNEDEVKENLKSSHGVVCVRKEDSEESICKVAKCILE